MGPNPRPIQFRKVADETKMSTVPILCLLAVIGMLSPSCMANQYRNSLKSGESLKASEALNSGDYSFIMQPNCNLVLYHDSTAVWSTGTGGKDYSCYAELLRGGNLVVYSPKNVSLWESSTGTTGSEYVLILQKDGNVVIYGPARWTVAWPRGNIASDQRLVSPEPTNILYTSERLKTDESLILGSFKCTIQTDCNLACSNDTRFVWSTSTAGKGSECYLELEGNGKLTIYDRANARVWGLNGWSGGSYVLLIQKSPILGIYGPEFWSTNWDGLTSNSTAQISNRKIDMVMSQ